MRICHCETNNTAIWKEITDDSDIRELWDAYSFELTKITKMNYNCSQYILASNQTTKLPKNIRIDTNLCVEIDCDIELTERAATKRIEIIFSGLNKLNFCPHDMENNDFSFCGFFDTVVLKRIDDNFYFGETARTKLNEFGYCDESTWIKCKRIFWRKIDYSVDV
jgi:hypothetical protein